MSIPNVGLRADIRQQLSFGYDCNAEIVLDCLWVPKMSSDLLARDDAYRVVAFPRARTTVAHLVRPRVGSCVCAYDVLAHRQDRVETLQGFNPFILFTGVGAEYLIRARSSGLSSAWGSRRDWTMALSFLYVALVRILQLLRLHLSDNSELV